MRYWTFLYILAHYECPYYYYYYYHYHYASVKVLLS